MPLVNNVGAIPGAAGGRWHNIIATACHFATVFWLFRTEFSRLPTPPAPPDPGEMGAAGNLTAVVTNMIALGQQQNQPVMGALQLTAGDVVVFVHNGQAAHSCVADTANTLTGYNQVNWFTGAGANHDITTHNTNEIRWGAGGQQNKVQGNVPNMWCELYAIPENSARAIVRQAFQH